MVAVCSIDLAGRPHELTQRALAFDQTLFLSKHRAHDAAVVGYRVPDLHAPCWTLAIGRYPNQFARKLKHKVDSQIEFLHLNCFRKYVPLVKEIRKL